MSGSERQRVPGEPGIWVLILGDLVIFAIFFCVFATYRTAESASFVSGRATLDTTLGLVNTLALLSSSLLVAIGVHRVRETREGAPRLFGCAAALGGLFVAIKVAEYTSKFTAGIGFGTSSFYMLYFAFTAIHLVHVVIGIGVLMALRAVSSKPDANQRMVIVGSGASFWHLVDILWIILFTLFYLVA